MMTLTLALDPLTAAWLRRESAAADRPPTDFVAELLRELADPDGDEGELIDRLLSAAIVHFPPVMTLDEQAEMREEVLDHLCRRLVETYRELTGEPMGLSEQVAFRDRLSERARTTWE